MRKTGFSTLFKEAASLWMTHNDSRLGAALAYYAVLSLAPMTLLCIAICGRVFGAAAVRGQVYFETRNFMGREAAAVVQTLLKAAHKPRTSLFATVAGGVTLLFGASGVFVELRDTLNLIWEAPPASSSLLSVVGSRFFSFAMVSLAGLLLMASLALSTFVQAAGAYASHFITLPAPLVEAGNSVVGFIVLAFLFALIYRIVPDVSIDWRDVVLGAAMTAALFVAGKFVLALYLGRAGIGSPYGAAGSLVVLLVWVYYSAQIFLFGAEFTHVYARRVGSIAAKRAPRLR